MPGEAEGGCLCGAIRFLASGPPKWTAYCHCSSCRKQTGAPVSAYAGFELPQVRITQGEPQTYASSEGVVRSFCGRCGGAVAYRGARWPTEIHLHVGLFDDPEPFAPTGHAFPEERLSWMHFSEPPPG